MSRPSALARSLVVTPLAAATLLAAATSMAAPTPAGTDLAAERPATWDMSREELEAIGLGQPRPAPVVLPWPRDEGAPIEPQALRQGVVFVNFEGIALEMGFDDSRTDVSGIFGGVFEPFGGTAGDRAAVMESMRSDWSLYDVILTDERPAAGDYTMNVTSPTNPIGGGVLGIAPLDCGDMQTHNNITFAFHGATDPPSLVATTISHEVGHSFGLEHVDEPADVMNPFNSGGDPSFRDECIEVVDAGPCGPQHEVHCGPTMTQNSHLELLGLFGSSIPDTLSPIVEITAPGDGDYFEVGANFRIAASVTDDNAITSVQLFDADMPLLMATEEPYGWDVVMIPEGVYDFVVHATDIAGNETISETVTVYVGIEPPEGVDDSGDGTGTGGPGADDDGGDGCGCAQTGSRDRGGLLLGIGVLGLHRRRRSPRA